MRVVDFEIAPEVTGYIDAAVGGYKAFYEWAEWPFEKAFGSEDDFRDYIADVFALFLVDLAALPYLFIFPEAKTAALRQKYYKQRKDLLHFSSSKIFQDLRAMRGSDVDKVMMLLATIIEVLKANDADSQRQEENEDKGVLVQVEPFLTLLSPFSGEGGGGHGAGVGHGKVLYYEETDEYKNRISSLMERMYTEKIDLVWELAKSFTASLDEAQEGMFVDSRVPTTNTDIANMRSAADLRNVTNHEKVLDDAVFDAKLSKRDLKVNQYRKRVTPYTIYYVLADNSSSTDEAYRAPFIKALSLALAKKAQDEGSPFFFRFFDDETHDRIDLSDFTKLASEIMLRRPTGGTYLNNAIDQACEDIKQELYERGEVQIMLITDGTQDIEPEEMKHRGWNEDYPINVCHVVSQGGMDVLPKLHDVARKYFTVPCDDIDKVLASGAEIVKDLKEVHQ